MRGLVCVLAVMCLMAYLGGVYEATQPKPHRVAVNRVDPNTCYRGWIASVWTEPGSSLLRVQCRDGIEMDVLPR